MVILQNTAIAIGVASVILLWVFSAYGAAHTLWDTFGDHAGDLIDRFRR